MGSPFIALTKDLMAMILLFVTVILFSLSGISISAVYPVGDSAGWTIIGQPDYKKWASSKKFRVGDTLLFSYHKQYHDVMEVSHQDYIHCNTNSAKAFYHSGSDKINLTKTGDFYFICSNDGHCLAGQKLHIKVHHTEHPSTAPATAPCCPNPGDRDGKGPLSVSMSPIIVALAGLDPSSNNAASLIASCLTIATVLAFGTNFLV